MKCSQFLNIIAYKNIYEKIYLINNYSFYNRYVLNNSISKNKTIDIWDKVLKVLDSKMTQTAYLIWIEPLKVEILTHDCVVVKTHSFLFSILLKNILNILLKIHLKKLQIYTH